MLRGPTVIAELFVLFTADVVYSLNGEWGYCLLDDNFSQYTLAMDPEYEQRLLHVQNGQQSPFGLVCIDSSWVLFLEYSIFTRAALC